jgi:hypothetical protein
MGGSGLKGLLELFTRHVNMVRGWDVGPVNAPVRMWRAGNSRLHRAVGDAELFPRITRGRCTEELLTGRHFELLRSPWVRELATRLGGALTEREGGARASGLRQGTLWQKKRSSRR